MNGVLMVSQLPASMWWTIAFFIVLGVVGVFGVIKGWGI